MSSAAKPIIRHAVDDPSAQSISKTQRNIADSSYKSPNSHPIMMQMGTKSEKSVQSAKEEESEGTTLLEHIKHTIVNPTDAASEVMGRIVGKEHYHHKPSQN